MLFLFSLHHVRVVAPCEPRVCEGACCCSLIFGNKSFASRTVLEFLKILLFIIIYLKLIKNFIIYYYLVKSHSQMNRGINGVVAPYLVKYHLQIYDRLI